jgi:uncharacterized membrane protein YoaK (UPF0700 family)
MDIFSLIDLRSVSFASLWIIGLAIILTAFGFIHYYAQVESRRSMEIIKQPIYQVVISIGLMLFCIGLSGGTDNLLESILWILLAIGIGVYLFSVWRKIRRTR